MTALFLPSVVVIDGINYPDVNGFVTALGVRALRLSGRTVPSAMLDALETCRTEQGGFRFWPSAHRPHWAPNLPDDADDTALMTLELLFGGRLSREEARRIACLCLVRNRVRRIDGFGPPWRRVGVFKTWARETTEIDLIDCTAHANILALMATLDLLHLPGVREAYAMLEAALHFAQNDAKRANSLSPFYPYPIEFVLALDHAWSCGAYDLAPLAQRAACASWGHNAALWTHDQNYAICSNPYGQAFWHSPELASIRAGKIPAMLMDECTY
ncbi:MAG: hypothetical protein OEW13_00135 [Nitrospira sp.]|nr:hypothetical protein [Nitrospira sp.]